MTLERRQPMRRDGEGARRFAATRAQMKPGRKPLARQSVKAAAERDVQAAVRDVVFARDGYRCVVAPFARAVLDWTQDGEARTVIVPACSGRLEFAHRRKASAGGAYVVANATTCCSAHNRWQEDYPDAARAIGGECPWWLVVLEGDDEWTSLGRKAAGVR